MALVAGNVTALCVALLSGPCSTYADGTGLFTGPTLPSQATCESLFAGITAGYDSDKWGNTIGCRQHYATMATMAAPYYCQFASLVGGGVCGTPLNNTCGALTSICGGKANYPYTSYDDCFSQLSPFNLTIGSLQGPNGGNENSLECRVYHATASVVANDLTHCGHVGPTTGPCVANPVGTNVTHYCALSEVACTGTYQQYFGGDAATMWASCTNIAATWPTGPFVFGAGTADLPGHLYHVFAAATTITGTSGGNNAHCAHAGPSGGGVVGTTWKAWAQAAQNAPCMANNGTKYVSTSVGEALMDWPMQLMMAITADATPGAYSVPSLSGSSANSETCRTYHLTAAASSPANAAAHCAHGGILSLPCGGSMGADIICTLINASCPSNYKDAASCKTAIGPYLTDTTKMGNPCVSMANPPTDDSLACRIYYTTLALIDVGKNNMTMGSSTNCKNAQVAGATGCGMMMAPTSAAAPVAASALVSFLMLLW